jgi:hypothetical protein
MRLLFHIGMGKTGTSSIQLALENGSDELAEQNARYLGMWFDWVDPSFHGYAGEQKFFRLEAHAQADCAERFIAVLDDLRQRQGVTTFIMSNESLFGAGATMAPFFDRLAQRAESLEFIAYLRDPRAWLPSAFSQWELRHKAHPGPIRPYGQSARELVGQYEGIRFWLENHAERLTVRPYESSGDVVRDFAETVGISLPPLETRFLERAEPADLLLRAMFNNRIPGPAWPDAFDSMVVDTSKARVPSLREMADTCFRHDGTDDIIAERRALFEYIRDKLGFDFLGGAAPEPRIPDEAELQRRVLDYLVEVTLDQARRLNRLERLMNELNVPQTSE